MDVNEKVFKVIQKSESVGNYFFKLISNQTYEKKVKYIEATIYFASINNKNILIRTKALAYIRFMKEMSIDPVWKEGEIIEEFGKNINTLLEQNVQEIIKLVTTLPEYFFLDRDCLYLCLEILLTLRAFKIDKNLFNNLGTALYSNLNLINENNQEVLLLYKDSIYQTLSALKKIYI